MDLPPLYNPWPRRLRFVLLLLLFAAGLAIAGFEKGRPEEAARVRDRGYAILTSYLEPVSSQTNSALEMARRFRHLWHTEADNESMRRELTRLQAESQQLSEQLAKMERLSGLGQWTAPPALAFVPADVIGLDTHEQNAVLIVNRGSADGIEPRDPMVSLGGLVGLVREVTPHSARVQAISDPISAVGAMVEQTRSRGIVLGRGRAQPLEFKPENEVQPINAGNRLVTSGFDNSVFPKGILVGTISIGKRNVHGAELAQVEPAVAFAQVEEGLIIVPRGRSAAADMESTATLGRFQIVMPKPSPNPEAITSATLTGSGDEAAQITDAESSGSLISIRATSQTQTHIGPQTHSTSPTLERMPAARGRDGVTSASANTARGRGGAAATPTAKPTPTIKPTPTPKQTPKPTPTESPTPKPFGYRTP